MNGGFIYVPEKESDYPICMAYDDAEDIVIPESFKVSFKPPYEDQGTTGSCVAHTVANIVEVMIHKYLKSPKIRELIAKVNGLDYISDKVSEDKHINVSVGFTYGNRYPGQLLNSPGMTGYQACDNLISDGAILAVMFEDDSEVPDITEAVKKFKDEHPEWHDYAIVPLRYVRTSKENEVKKFMMRYNVPILTVSAVSKFWIGSGYHAMPCYGWNGSTALLQNSWGEDSHLKDIELDFDDIKEFWMIVPFLPAEFSDIDDSHWAYDDVMTCVSKGVVQGYPDGTFRPSANVTRAEAAAIVYRILKEGKKI